MVKITQNFNLNDLLAVTIRKTLEFKGVELFTEEEFKIFWDQLKNDEEFIQACENIFK